MRNKELVSKSFSNASVLTYSFLISHFLFLILLSSCSIQKKISHSANLVIKDSSLQTAHIGISIYEPGSGKYWYNYQGDKYFVPASNTKIPTCYAAMKYLGDSLVGLRYSIQDSVCMVMPAGDPSFLNNEFKRQPVYDFLKSIGKSIIINTGSWQEKSLGSGWSWSDYEEDYMAERSMLPMYGNTVTIRLDTVMVDASNTLHHAFRLSIPYFKNDIHLSADSDLFTYRGTYVNLYGPQHFDLVRELGENDFRIHPSKTIFTAKTFPFVTSDPLTLAGLLNDTLKGTRVTTRDVYQYERNELRIMHSQPTDSLLKPMMHRSDNFFAEQSLLMVSNERLGIMSDEKIIDTLLKTDFKDLPQKPRWVDGCGLSRYNLFTPQDFVFILHKMQQEFGMDRVKNILATGGEGTLSNYYKADKGYIYAKTGSLSGVLCLSGFLYTKKNKLLIFSVLVNNYRSSPSNVRKAVEKFLESTRNSY